MMVILVLAGFFVWAMVYKITFKLKFVATVESGEISLVIDESRLENVKVGQTVYIGNQKGEIKTVENDNVEFTEFTLADGVYDGYIVLKEVRPIDYFKNVL